MKKQLLTGALTLSVLLGSTGMAFAADMPAVELMKADAVSVKADFVKDTAFDHFKMSDQKIYTADSYAAELEQTKAGLNDLVKNNELTRADADKMIDRMEQDLQKIKDGSFTLYYYDMLDKDGNAIGKVSQATFPAIKIGSEDAADNSVQTSICSLKLIDLAAK